MPPLFFHRLVREVAVVVLMFVAKELVRRIRRA
jgi:hypothetical protein